MFYSGDVVVAGLLAALLVFGLVGGLVGFAWLMENRTRRSRVRALTERLAAPGLSLIDEITEWLSRQ